MSFYKNFVFCLFLLISWLVVAVVFFKVSFYHNFVFFPTDLLVGCSCCGFSCCLLPIMMVVSVLFFMPSFKDGMMRVR